MSDNSFGSDRADTFNQATPQILLNPCQRGRFGFAIFNHLKLLTILEMFFPSALELKSLSGLDIGKVTDDRRLGGAQASSPSHEREVFVIERQYNHFRQNER